jgi:hypothetical protein
MIISIQRMLMRFLMILSWLISIPVFAQEDFEKRLESLKKKQKDNDEFQLGIKYQFRGIYPAQEGYLSELMNLRRKHHDEILKLYDEECTKTQKGCLSGKEKQTLQSQIRIDLGLMVLKDQWAREKISRGEVASKTQDYLRSAQSCRDEGKCENVPTVSSPASTSGEGATTSEIVPPKPEEGGRVENGRDEVGTNPSAVEGTIRKGSTDEVVTPLVSADEDRADEEMGGPPKTSEVKLPEALDGDVAEGEASGEVLAPVLDIVSPTGSRETASVDSIVRQATINLNKELKAQEDALRRISDSNPITQEILNRAKSFETAKIQKTIAVFEELCQTYPTDVKVCLTPEAKKLISEEAQGSTCFYERRFQFDSAQDKSKFKAVSEVKKHIDEWNALSSPKLCKTLLDMDKQLTPQTEVSEDQEPEDKRNYQSDKCVWVTNIPRKVVTGVSCGKSKNNTCVGYVSCPRKQGGGVFTRMSTCRASLCGNEDAVKCTQDLAYWSRRPSGEDKEFLSREVQKVIRTSRQ